MSKFSRLGHALYEGKVSIDFVGRKWLWYSISGLILLLAIARPRASSGLNLGIEFDGRRRVPRRACRPSQVDPGQRRRRSATRSPEAGRGHRRRRVADRQHLGQRTTSGSRPSR